MSDVLRRRWNRNYIFQINVKKIIINGRSLGEQGRRLFRDLMKKRWAVLVASVIVNICIGTGFAWSVYQTGLFNEVAVIFGTEVQKS